MARKIHVVVVAVAWLVCPFGSEGEAGEFENIATELEAAAVTGEDLPSRKKSSYNNINRAVRFEIETTRYLRTIAKNDLKAIENYLKNYLKREANAGQGDSSIITLNKLLTSLADAKYDYSWYKKLKDYGEKVQKAYSGAKGLHKLGVKKQNARLVRIAVLKFQLLESYKDSDKLLLAAKKDLSALTETKKTEATVAKQKADDARKATGEKIAAQKAHEEAVRAEKLKVIRAKAEAERAKAAAERAKKYATELEALTKVNQAKIEALIKEKMKAELERIKAKKAIAAGKRKYGYLRGYVVGVVTAKLYAAEAPDAMKMIRLEAGLQRAWAEGAATKLNLTGEERDGFIEGGMDGIAERPNKLRQK